MKKYLIFLKQQKEPIEVSAENGKAIQECLNDESFSLDSYITVGGDSFKKSEIRFLKEEEETNTNTRETFFYIYNTKRNSVIMLPDGKTDFPNGTQAQKWLDRYIYKHDCIVRETSRAKK